MSRTPEVMQLAVLDRLLLMSALPKEGDITTIKIVRELKESLSFSEEEHEPLSFHTEGAQLVWGHTGTCEACVAGRGAGKSWTPLDKPFEFDKKAFEIAQTALRGLSGSGKLQEEHLSLWDKFIGE